LLPYFWCLPVPYQNIRRNPSPPATIVRPVARPGPWRGTPWSWSWRRHASAPGAGSTLQPFNPHVRVWVYCHSEKWQRGLKSFFVFPAGRTVFFFRHRRQCVFNDDVQNQHSYIPAIAGFPCVIRLRGQSLPSVVPSPPPPVPPPPAPGPREAPGVPPLPLLGSLLRDRWAPVNAVWRPRAPPSRPTQHPLGGGGVVLNT